MANSVKSVHHPKFMSIKIEATVQKFGLADVQFSIAWTVTDPINIISNVLTCNLTSIVSCSARLIYRFD